jgi:hypothetical protein
LIAQGITRPVFLVGAQEQRLPPKSAKTDRYEPMVPFGIQQHQGFALNRGTLPLKITVPEWAA